MDQNSHPFWSVSITESFGKFKTTLKGLTYIEGVVTGEDKNCLLSEVDILGFSK